jgi:CheY-like chemotaxis protein
MTPSVRILHLEDDAADARLIQGMLRADGLQAEVTTVGDRQAFLNALEEDEFDLMLADFNLPAYDGLQALAEWRSRWPERPFVFVSGLMGEELAIQSLKNGAIDYVLKGNLARLVPAVRRALADADERARRQEAEEDLREAQRLARIGNWRWYAESDTTLGSKGLLLLFGLDPANQSLPRFRDQRGLLYPVDAWERLHQASLQSLRTGVGYEFDLQAFRGGSTIWVTARGETLRDRKGTITGLRGTVQDITARKQIEEDLRAANRDLTRFNQVTMGRELRIIELKKQVNSLCARLGEPPAYRTDLDGTQSEAATKPREQSTCAPPPQ